MTEGHNKDLTDTAGSENREQDREKSSPSSEQPQQKGGAAPPAQGSTGAGRSVDYHRALDDQRPSEYDKGIPALPPTNVYLTGLMGCGKSTVGWHLSQISGLGFVDLDQWIEQKVGRSVHEILQKEFGLANGLADTTTWGEMKARSKDLEIPAGVKETAPFVQILDPATGTGTFLVEVIEQIHKTLEAKWQREGKSKPAQIEAWNEYVP